MAALGRSQDWLAGELGMHPSLLSRVLRGLRPTPDDFDQRVGAVLAQHERAERAAAKARAAVLNGTPPEEAA